MQGKLAQLAQGNASLRRAMLPFANFPGVILRNRIADHPSAMGSFLRGMIFFHLSLLSRQDVRIFPPRLVQEMTLTLVPNSIPGERCALSALQMLWARL